MRSLLLLCAILFQAQALATSCRSIPADEAIASLNALFQRAPIVAFVDSLNEPDQGATEVAVVRVWKGEIDSTSYLTGRSSLGLIFAERLDDGPLHRIDRDVSTYCVVSNLSPGEYIPTVDKLERLWAQVSNLIHQILNRSPLTFRLAGWFH